MRMRIKARSRWLDKDGKPLVVTWRYNRAETIADGIVHVLGATAALAAGATLIALAARFAAPPTIIAVVIYVVCLIAGLVISAAYNMWPISATKWVLRRLDHSAIFLLIAGSYTPFLIQIEEPLISIGLLAAVWAIALAGIALKLSRPGYLDRFSIGLYLALGWSGLIAFDSIVTQLPGAAPTLLVVGGVLYSVGVIFHLWQRLRFQNALWHAFVLLAAACHYAAVMTLVLPVTPASS
jgi:hemolysin III